MFNVLSTFTSNTFIKCYIGYGNFLVLSYTGIFVFMLTLFCPFESGILMTTLEKQILHVQEWHFIRWYLISFLRSPLSRPWELGKRSPQKLSISAGYTNTSPREMIRNLIALWVNGVYYLERKSCWRRKERTTGVGSIWKSGKGEKPLVCVLCWTITYCMRWGRASSSKSFDDSPKQNKATSSIKKALHRRRKSDSSPLFEKEKEIISLSLTHI